MFTYYVQLALRALRHHVVLTALIIAAIGVGIGASMTTLTVYRDMAADPIPEKSAELYAVQIDNWGPTGGLGPAGSDRLQDQISYTDSIGLMRAHAGARQAAMYATALPLIPDDPRLRPFRVMVRATYADFFPMFDVPFRYGGPWGAGAHAARGAGVGVAPARNAKLFGGANSVGRTLNLDAHLYRVVGVLERWQPVPRFYDPTSDKYGKAEDLYLPFSRAIDGHMSPWGNINCNGKVGSGWQGRLNSECVWNQFWV